MSDDATLFWPSLYARLVPSRYGEEPSEAEMAGAPEEVGGDLASAAGLGAFFLDFDTLRRHVQIDLVELLNASSLEAAMLALKYGGDPYDKQVEQPLGDYPLVQQSILNYGVPVFVGQSSGTQSDLLVQERLRRAVKAFEPRLDPRQLVVTVDLPTRDLNQEDWRVDLKIESEIRVLDNEQGLRLIVESKWDREGMDTMVDVVV